MPRYEPHPKSPVLADLLVSGHRLEAWCCGCHRWGLLSPEDAVRLLGPRTTFPEASRRLRCAECGARGRDGMVSARIAILDIYAAMERDFGLKMPTHASSGKPPRAAAEAPRRPRRWRSR